jgi:hypothetical protein
MKKNKMMRLASCLLVLCLLTTCVISGTFAKYTTSGEASDSARVAAFGVTVEVTGDGFSSTYAKDTKDTTASAITNSVVSIDDDKLVAPGTSGDFYSATITGTPEVAVEVTNSATLTISDDWQVTIGEGEDAVSEEYFPIIITVNGVNYSVGNVEETKTVKNASGEVTGYVYASVADLKTGVENAISGISGTYAANTDLSAVTDSPVPTVSWRWEFSNPDEDAYQTDEKDTALGNLVEDAGVPVVTEYPVDDVQNDVSKNLTGPTIELKVTTTVTQID